ncbi:MAG: hypothetical protein AB7E47_05590 [Desulfovibrionaceae bacterium]
MARGNHKSKIGVLHVDHALQDGEGVRRTSAFFRDMVVGFIDLSAEYCRSEGDFPFCYKEMQSVPTLCAAISRQTPCFMAEAPVVRGAKGDDGGSRGRVDIWARHKSECYFIEAKHNFIGLDKQCELKDISAKWQVALEQLDSVRKQIKGWWGEGAQSRYLVSLMIAPYYWNATKSDNVERVGDDEVWAAHSGVCAALQPNWWALCTISPEWRGPYQYSLSTECHPALGIYIHAEGVSV